MPKPIIYEPHPVLPERKAELVAQGFVIVDAAFAPAGEAGPKDTKPQDTAPAAETARPETPPSPRMGGTIRGRGHRGG